MVVNVLGTDYTVVVDEKENNPKMQGASGYIELYSKKIVLKNIQESKMSFEDVDEFRRKVLRHEIAHAFFHEAGASDYCDDEKLIDWLALIIPKMFTAMQKAECL